MTYLQLVNAVLLRLREDSATTLTDSDYVELIAALVNETKRDVEDSWDWSHLRTYVDVSAVNGTSEYSLTGCNERTRILQAFNTTKKWEMLPVGTTKYINMLQSITPTSGSPTHYDIAQYDATTDTMKVRLWPTPNASETIRFFVVQPQADLSASSDILKVPSDPVVQGTYLRAINERGEDQGRLSDIQAALYSTSLGNHIAIDANKFSCETTWQPI